MIYTAALQLHIQVRNREEHLALSFWSAFWGSVRSSSKSETSLSEILLPRCRTLPVLLFLPPSAFSIIFLGYISDCHDIYTFVCVARKRTTDNIPFIISLTRRGASLTVICFVYKNFRMNIPTHTIWIPISWLEDETKLWNRVTKQKRKEKMSLIEHWNSLPPSPLRLVSQTCSLPISARRLFLGGEDWPL